jgi:NADH-quinone oxidoreductase E subunit
MSNVKSKEFVFNEENLIFSEKVIAKYPAGKQKSAILPLLDLAQRQNGGWISGEVVEYMSNFLGMPAIRIFEVVSFYTMFNTKPLGKHHVQICRTTPCWLRGSDKLSERCKKVLNIKKGKTSAGNQFTFSEVECLGACRNAPVVQINDDYYDDLTPNKFESLLKKLAKE